MRISDWSSDVCSSDLKEAHFEFEVEPGGRAERWQGVLIKALAHAKRAAQFRPADQNRRSPGVIRRWDIMIVQGQLVVRAVDYLSAPYGMMDPYEEIRKAADRRDRKSTRLNSSH